MAGNSQTTDPPLINNRGGLLAAALLGVLLLVLAMNYLLGRRASVVRSDAAAVSQAMEADAVQGVTIEQQGADDAVLRIIVPCPSATTVLDAMRLAAERDPAWEFTYEGAGESAFLTQLGQQANQGAEGNNWQYEVQGERANVSFGALQLVPGDRVLWKFAPYE